VKVIIAGGREYKDYANLRKVCDEIFELNGIEDPEIVSGTARGTDKMGEFYAKQRGFKIRGFPADWNKFGKKAGHIRNGQMARYSDMLILFWDGKSRGSKDMLEQATEERLLTHVIRYSDGI